MLKRKCFKSVSLVLVIMLAATMFAGLSFPSKVSAATVGNVDLSGDPTFDSDSVSDSSSIYQTRWLSYPGSRFSLNANDKDNVFQDMGPMETNLPLNMGGWIGTAWKNLNNTVQVQVAPTGGSFNNASSVSTAWYPYKITFNANYANPDGTTLSGYDFNVDANGSVVRVIQVNGTGSKQIKLSGTVNGTGAVWDAANRVILVSGSNYYYAIRIVGLTGAGLTPIELIESAAVNGSTWTFTKQFDSTGALGISFGFATSGEGSAVAISRARGCLSGSIATSLATVKSYFDTQLRKAPKPANYGINGVPSKGVTPDQHRRAYYMAWTFIISDLMGIMPENTNYPYYQELCGKPSSWPNGDPRCPGSCTWNSSIGLLFLAYIMPDEAWNAYQGLLSLIDDNGQIPGESLPTRFAQLGWLLYKKTGDLTKLNSIYPSLKSHLLWAEQNPRWIYDPGGYNHPGEKDMDFCSSWLFDTDFAIKIAQVLGQTADVTMWGQHQQTMISNMRTWFFATPGVVFQYYDPAGRPSDSKFIGVNKVNEGAEMMRDSALAIKNLPDDMYVPIKNLFFSEYNPYEDIGGLKWTKPVNSDLITYGLLDKGEKQAAYGFIQSSLRDAVSVRRIPDVYNSNPLGINDVRPSAFGAAMLIEYTWLANGMRFDSGTETAIDFGTLVQSAASTLEDFSDVSDWSGSDANISTGNGIATITTTTTYGYVSKSVTCNVSTYPYITINVPELGAGALWALKLNDGGMDIELVSNFSGTGEYTYRLPAGWSGNKTFTVKLFSVGGSGKYFKADYLNVASSLKTTIDNFNLISGWTGTNASISANSTVYSSKLGAVVCGNASYGSVSKNVTYNVDTFPYITINVPEVGTGAYAGSQWALKVNSGGADITLQPDTSQTGIFSYNLKAITGWSGNKTMNIVLYAIGGNGKYFKVDSINVAATGPVMNSFILDDFNGVSDWGNPMNGSIVANSGIARVATTTSYGSVSKSVGYNVDYYPTITINVPEIGTGAAWALKVNDGGGDIAIRTDTTATGVLTYNLKSITGWSGFKTFNVVLYAIGGNGKYFKVDNISVQ